MGKKASIHQFIETERASGTTEEDIKNQLMSAGWQFDLVHHAMGNENSNNKGGSVTDIQAYSGNTPKPPFDWKSLLTKPLLWVGVFLLLILIAAFI